MNNCLSCGGEYGPPGPVSVPLRTLPSVQISGIEGQRCLSCGDYQYDLPDSEALIEIVIETLLHKSTRLTGAEARFLREILGWNGKETAERLGFTPERVSRWERDKMKISETADKFLRSLVKLRESIGDFSTWEAELASLAKSDPDPTASIVMLWKGDRWALRAA